MYIFNFEAILLLHCLGMGFFKEYNNFNLFDFSNEDKNSILVSWLILQNKKFQEEF